ALQRQIGRRAGHRVAGAAPLLAVERRHALLGEVGKLEIIEEQVDEFLARQDEAEIVLAAAIGAAFGAATAAPTARPLDRVALDEPVVAGKDIVLGAGLAVAAERRLAHTVDRDRDLAALVEPLDVAFLGAVPDRPLHQGLGAPQKPLSVCEAFSTRIEAPVDD